MSNKKEFGTFYGVGVGPGDPSMLTLKAVEVLQSVDIIFQAIGKNSKTSISASVVDSVPHCHGHRENLIFSMSRSIEERAALWHQNALRVAEELRQGKNCAFVTIGDPLIYSTFTYLLSEVQKLIPEVSVTTVPGITSFQYSAAQKNRAIVEDLDSFLLLPAWNEDYIDQELIKRADSIVCLKSYRSRNKILKTLQETGKEILLYAEKVGLPEEIILSDIETIKERDHQYLSHIIARGKPCQ